MNGGVYVPVIYDRRLKCRFKKSSQAGASFQAVTDTLTLRVQAALSPLPPTPPPSLNFVFIFQEIFRGGCLFFFFSSRSQSLGLGWELEGKDVVVLGTGKGEEGEGRGELN